MQIQILNLQKSSCEIFINRWVITAAHCCDTEDRERPWRAALPSQENISINVI